MESFFKKTKHFFTKPRKAAVENSSGPHKPGWFFRLSLEEQMLFAKRLSILLKSGIPILQALSMMQEQMTSGNAAIVLRDLAQGVENGQALHLRLSKYRKYFGDFAVNIIRVGEVSGTLHYNLAYLAQEIKKKRDLRRKIVSALIYPALIVVAAFGITILLITYVFPKILPVLQTFKGQLPFTTRTLIFLSKLLSTKGWIIAAVVLATIILIVFLKRSLPKFNLWLHRQVLRLPFLGRLFVAYYMANFCRTLGILLKSDVRIAEAAVITANTFTNLAYRESLLELVQHLYKGGRVSTFLESNVKLFPSMIRQMVMVGEGTGRLSESLMYLAEIYEQEVDDMTKNLSTAIEPVLMIFMGLLVGFIAMSIITPIYSLTQNLSR